MQKDPNEQIAKQQQLVVEQQSRFGKMLALIGEDIEKSSKDVGQKFRKSITDIPKTIGTGLKLSLMRQLTPAEMAVGAGIGAVGRGIGRYGGALLGRSSEAITTDTDKFDDFLDEEIGGDEETQEFQSEQLYEINEQLYNVSEKLDPLEFIRRDVNELLNIFKRNQLKEYEREREADTLEGQFTQIMPSIAAIGSDVKPQDDLISKTGSSIADKGKAALGGAGATAAALKGKAILAKGAMLGKGALAIGAGALSLPLLATIAGTAAAGYGGYRLYQHMQERGHSEDERYDPAYDQIQPEMDEDFVSPNSVEGLEQQIEELRRQQSGRWSERGRRADQAAIDHLQQRIDRMQESVEEPATTISTPNNEISILTGSEDVSETTTPAESSTTLESASTSELERETTTSGTTTYSGIQINSYGDFRNKLENQELTRSAISSYYAHNPEDLRKDLEDFIQSERGDMDRFGPGGWGRYYAVQLGRQGLIKQSNDRRNAFEGQMRLNAITALQQHDSEDIDSEPTTSTIPEVSSTTPNIPEPEIEVEESTPGTSDAIGPIPSTEESSAVPFIGQLEMDADTGETVSLSAIPDSERTVITESASYDATEKARELLSNLGLEETPELVDAVENTIIDSARKLIDSQDLEETPQLMQKLIDNIEMRRGSDGRYVTNIQGAVRRDHQDSDARVFLTPEEDAQLQQIRQESGLSEIGFAFSQGHSDFLQQVRGEASSDMIERESMPSQFISEQEETDRLRDEVETQGQTSINAPTVNNNNMNNYNSPTVVHKNTPEPQGRPTYPSDLYWQNL